MDDPRIVELLTEILQEQKRTNFRLDNIELRLDNIELRLDNIELRVERLEKQQQTTNLKLQELTLSNLRIADELHTVGERFDRLEAAVFH